MSVLQQNSDGLVVKYPGYYADPANNTNQVRTVQTYGATRQIFVDYDLTQIPTGTTSFSTDLTNAGTVNGFNDGDPRLPANASVTKVIVLTTVAHTGGTSFTVGTYSLGGTTLSANSLVTATEGAIANFGTIGLRTYGAGALVSTSAGTAGVGVYDAYPGITTSGTYTAGKGRIIIEYIEPLADVETNNE